MELLVIHYRDQTLHLVQFNKYNMIIKQALELLAGDDWLIEDKDIQIAKGLYELPTTFAELKMNNKRKKLAK